MANNHGTTQLLSRFEGLSQRALSFAPVGVAFVGLDGKWRWVNERGCALLGHSKAELQALPWEEIVHPDDRALAARLPWVAARDGARPMVVTDETHRFVVEQRYLRRDGSMWWGKLSVTLLHDDDGTPREWMLVLDDVSELRGRIERLEQESERLSLRGREAQGVMHSIAHELRGPLRHIAGYVQMIPEHCGAGASDELKRIVRVVEEGAVRMQSMIDALLRLGEFGQGALHCEDVDMDQLVREVLGKHWPEGTTGRVDVQLGQLPNAFGDRALLRHVWDNLIANAFKYTRNQVNPVIVITGRKTSSGRTDFWVRDNGIGFDNQHAKRIFEPFQRMCGSEFEGHGVGLSLVARVIERHGGEVHAKGALGGGAKVGFSLPAAPA